MAYSASNALSFCQRQVGRYRDGECWTLIEDAVVGAGGRSSRVLTPRFSPNASFVWGTVTPVIGLQAGDVLQFSGYSWTRTTVTEVSNPDGSGSTNETFTTETRGAPQHTAMVVRVVSAGVVEVIEQNVPSRVGNVQTVMLVLSQPAQRVTTTRTPIAGGGETVTTVTVTDTVSNPPRCYRPIAA
ncbi:hypothetical protein [Tabrizicola sp.]|uniref:hypothetical protein n=1 Tax=Tabrizicola sp. TaxID=2005166 RepID=UPI003F38E6ED